MSKRAGVRFLTFKLPALAYMAFIFHMSSSPVTSGTLNAIPDYVLHSSGYAALYVLVFWAVHEDLDVRSGRGAYWLPVIFTILYGISDEFHQSFIPTRQCTLPDLGADAAGALAGVPLTVLAARATSAFRPRLRP